MADVRVRKTRIVTRIVIHDGGARPAGVLDGYDRGVAFAVNVDRGHRVLERGLDARLFAEHRHAHSARDQEPGLRVGVEAEDFVAVGVGRGFPCEKRRSVVDPCAADVRR